MKSNECYTFKFKISKFDRKGEIRIGGSTVKDYSGEDIGKQSGCCIGFKAQTCYYGRSLNNSYQTSIKEGDIIKVIFDMNSRYVHYKINGQEYNNVFQSINCPLYPFVELFSVGDKVKLLDVSKK